MNKTAVIFVLASTLAVSVCLNVFLYVQNQLETQANQDFTLYYKEYGNVSVISRSYNFSPPVSMYRALKIALESDGWNSTSLSGMTIRISLSRGKFFDESATFPRSLEAIYEVTQPVDSYSPVHKDDATYRYVWSITILETARLGALSIPPPGVYWVDAATAEIIPHAPLY